MDRKEAKWIVKRMREMYSDDGTILEIAKNSYHDRIISWDELILICDEIHYEFYDSFVEKPEEERRAACYKFNGIFERVDKYINEYKIWSALSFPKKIITWIKYHPISEFKKFMLNPAFVNLYNAAPPKVKAYYKLKWNYNYSKYWPEKRLKKMEDNFEKSDWEFLMSKSHSFEWYSYKKKMQEHFPNEDTER